MKSSQKVIRRTRLAFLLAMLPTSLCFGQGSTSATKKASPSSVSADLDKSSTKDIKHQNKAEKLDKSGKPIAKAKEDAKSSSKFGVGIDLGSNATYGNGLRVAFDPIHYFDVQAGVGYNSTGTKAGLGLAILLPMTDRFGLNTGASFVHSMGTNGDVSLPGKFSPEGGGEERITVTRKFKASPANYVSSFFGMHFAFTPVFRLVAQVNYNKVLSGNQMEFSQSAEYDTPVDPTNETEVNSDFEKKAREKYSIDGIGGSAGLQMRF